MNECYLSLGSNQKYPERQIRRAINLLRTINSTSIIKISSFYWTKAWGVSNQQDFCNAVIKISTRLTPLELLNACQKVEKRQGRVRKRLWGPRVIDIDILTYGMHRINSAQLTIPHPRMHLRDFVLLPLQELKNRPEH